MAAIEFTDSHGTRWKVWSTVPTSRSPVAKTLPDGWLTFECAAGTLRRLSPVPAGWEACAPERLELMCRAADEVTRLTPPLGAAAMDSSPPAAQEELA